MKLATLMLLLCPIMAFGRIIGIPTVHEQMASASSVVSQFISDYDEELEAVRKNEASGKIVKYDDKIGDKYDNAVMHTLNGPVSLTRMGMSFRRGPRTSSFKTVKEFKAAKRREMTKLCKNTYVKNEFSRRHFRIR